LLRMYHDECLALSACMRCDFFLLPRSVVPAHSHDHIQIARTEAVSMQFIPDGRQVHPEMIMLRLSVYASCSPIKFCISIATLEGAF